MYKRILVPIDGSATSERGIDEAIGVARLAGATIRLLHVLDELVFVSGFETGATYLNSVLPALRQRSDHILAAGRERVAAAAVAVETETVECFARRPSDVIVERATEWPADLIVLGTHGRRGFNRLLLGSDAEQVLRMASIPVLLVRAVDDTDGVPAAAAGAAVVAKISAATA